MHLFLLKEMGKPGICQRDTISFPGGQGLLLVFKQGTVPDFDVWIRGTTYGLEKGPAVPRLVNVRSGTKTAPFK